MSAIVPRSTYALLRSPYVRRYRAFSKWYNTGRAAAPYFKMAYNAWKSRRPRKRPRSYKAKSLKANRAKRRYFRRSIGHPVGQGTAKRTLDTTGLTSTLDTRTLVSYPLLNLAKAVASQDGEALDRRMRDIVNFRGVKVCLTLANTDVQSHPHLTVNIAVISPKNDTSAATIPDSEFFRAFGGNRDRPFVSTEPSIYYSCVAINTDKYNVYKRMKIKLGPSGRTNSTHLNCKDISFYIPLKRQIRYEGNVSAPQSKNMFLVMWCDYPNINGSAAIIPSALGYQYHFVKYFKEPKN